MEKAIVTGATGFIGRAVVKELIKNKVKVIVLTRKNSVNLTSLDGLPVSVIECNLVDIKKLPSLVPDRNIDVVFHLAWQGVSDADAKDQKVQLQNLVSTLELIDAMNDMGIGTIVGAGSMHEAESLIEMSEDKIISNLGYMYKASKTAAHWIGKAKAGNYGIRFFWPLINTYGEGERSARLVNTVICKVFKGEIPDLSKGDQFYDFVHVSDVAHALYLIADKGIDGTNYVIGSGEAKRLRDFLEIVGEVANEMKGGNKVPLGFGNISSEVIHLPLDTFEVDKLEGDTGFKPEISFEDGIRRTARWIWNERLK